MFFFLPYGTNAPIYYLPISTIGLIIANVVVFACTLSVDSNEQLIPYLLSYSDGLHPLSWFTSPFMHAGFGHLIGNMMFLWPFGLVIEGKIGWWRFFIVYMGIAVGACAMEQTISLFTAEEGYSLGASSAIFGLIAMSVVWAPKNELLCVIAYWFFFIPRVVNLTVPLLYFGLFYVLWEMLRAYLDSFALATPMLHLLGVALGFPIAFAMLLTKRVDCEGWDVITVWKGDYGAFAKEKEVQPLATAEQRQKDDAQKAAFLDKIRNLLSQDQGKLALKLHKKAKSLDGWRLPEKEHLAIIAALHKQGAAQDSIPLMVEFLAQFPDRSQRVRLKLGQILVRDELRPGQGLQVLSKLPEESLPEKLEHLRQRLIAEAKKLKATGETVELAPEDW